MQGIKVKNKARARIMEKLSWFVDGEQKLGLMGLVNNVEVDPLKMRISKKFRNMFEYSLIPASYLKLSLKLLKLTIL